MSNEVAIPDYLRDMMAEGTVQSTLASMETGAGGVPRVTTKGKIFRFKEGENEEKAGQSIKVIILGVNPEQGLSHTYYKDGYSPDSSDPPDCSSMNGVVPDNWIATPVSKTCAGCPNQVWGSAKSMSGGKAKACRDSKQIYLAKAKDFASDPDECTVYLMTVTVNSLKNFSTFGKELAAKGLPGPQFVITEIYMDEESSVPMTHYKILGVLNETLGPKSHQRSVKKEWESLSQALPAPSSTSNKSLPQHPDDDESEVLPEEDTKPKTKAKVDENVIDNDDDDDVNVDDLINDW